MEELRKWLDSHSQSELARALGITQGAVSQWLRAGEIPLGRVVDVSRITGIPLHKLAPKFFGVDAA